MEHRSMLSDVDLFAGEHGFDAASHVSLLSQSNKQVECFGGNPIFGIVEVNPRGFHAHALGALRVACEEVAKVKIADSLVVASKVLPGFGLAERFQSWNHESLSFPVPSLSSTRKNASRLSLANRPRGNSNRGWASIMVP